jgi:hypothetical protein
LKVPNKGLEQWGIGRKGKRHALQQLEKTDLVNIEHRASKSPIVELRFIY